MRPTHPVIEAIFAKAWNRGDFAGLSGFLAPEHSFHVGGKTRRMTADELRSAIQSWRDAFPDLSFEIHDTVVEGDLIAARMTLTGTNLGDWRGRPGTGRRISVDHMFMLRVEDDRVLEVWEVLDSLTMRSQLSGDEGS